MVLSLTLFIWMLLMCVELVQVLLIPVEITACHNLECPTPPQPANFIFEPYNKYNTNQSRPCTAC